MSWEIFPPGYIIHIFYPHWSNIAQGCNQWCHVIGQHEILGMGYFKGHLWVYNRALKKEVKDILRTLKSFYGLLKWRGLISDFSQTITSQLWPLFTPNWPHLTPFKNHKNPLYPFWPIWGQFWSILSQFWVRIGSKIIEIESFLAEHKSKAT